MPRRQRQREVKKAIGWIRKTTTARASRFFVHFFAVTAATGKCLNLTFYGGRKQATAKFSFSF